MSFINTPGILILINTLVLKNRLEEVVLVDKNGSPIGAMEKLEAHKKGLLHLAFSVFIFNAKGQLLLQQRALTKYHSAGLWTNTCCSHPRPGENILKAAKRRLVEEMGITSELTLNGFFTYCTHFENGLTEHEYDYVYTGVSDAKPILNKEEVGNYKWQSMESIRQEIKDSPKKFTSWFKIATEKFF